MKSMTGREELGRPEQHELVLADSHAAQNEISLQCLCGGFAMYWRRILLTSDEIEAFKNGTLDLNGLILDVCKEKPNVQGRFAPSFQGDDLPL